MTRTKYISISKDQIPDGVRFDCPRHLQGQMVVVEYGGFGRAEHCDGDLYKRVTDTSIGPNATEYFKRADHQ